MDLQAMLDDWFESHPEFHKYVTALYYVPDGTNPPEDATHTVTLESETSNERRLTVAAAVVPTYAAMVDALLALIATQPPAPAASAPGRATVKVQ